MNRLRLSWCCWLVLLADWGVSAGANTQIDSLRRLINQTRDPRIEFRLRASLTALLLNEGDLERAGTEVRILQRQARRLQEHDDQQLARFYYLQHACLTGENSSCAEFDSLATPELFSNPIFLLESDFEGLPGRLANLTGRFTSALRWGQLIEQQIRRNDGPLLLRANNLRQMANSAYSLGLKEKALDYIEKARSIYQRLEDAVGLSNTHYELGYFFSNRTHASPDDLRDAVAHFLRADELLANKPAYLEKRCHALLGAAYVYGELEDWPRVAELLQRVKNLRADASDSNDPIFEFNWLQLQTDWAKAQHQPAESVIASGRRMLELAQSTNNTSIQQIAYYNLADLLVYYQRPAEARPLLEKLVAQSLRPDLQLDALRLLASTCYTQGDWPAAARFYRQVSILGDSLARSESEQHSRQLAEQYSSELKDLQIARQQAQIERQNWQVAAIAGVLLLMGMLALALVRGRSRLHRLNRNLSLRNDRISQQNALLAEQHLKIEDSIRYASRIQYAILPESDWLARVLPPHFIFYKPKDIVSGDFFWAAQQGNRLLLAAVDCTGHGVPGAFMSVVGSNLLNQIVLYEGLTEPAAILQELDRRIAQTLRQSYRGENQDGMDLALIVLEGSDPRRPTAVHFAGARRPLLVATATGVQILEGNRFSCGGAQHIQKKFASQVLDPAQLRAIWLYSDGVTDQFGPWDEKRKRLRKLGQTRLAEWMNELADCPPGLAGAEIDRRFTDWMGGNPQLDDVLVIGLTLKTND